MRVTNLRVLLVFASLQVGVAGVLLAQEKVEPVKTGPAQGKKVVAVMQAAPETDVLGDMASMRGITDGALAGVLEGLISWDAGYGDVGDDVGGAGDFGDSRETGGPDGIDQDTWDQSGLGDDLGDYDDYSSDQDRQDAIDALAWEQSGAADSTGKSWDDFDNDEERNAALKEVGEEQKKEEEKSEDDSSSSEKKDGESTDDGNQQEEEGESDSSADGIVGKQFPLTQIGRRELQLHGVKAVQVSARAQIRKTLAQMLLNKGL